MDIAYWAAAVLNAYEGLFILNLRGELQIASKFDLTSCLDKTLDTFLTISSPFMK